MNEYKFSEDCFPQKERPDDLIERKTKIDYTSIPDLDSFIEQFHNFSQIPVENLLNIIESINKSIDDYPENERYDLIHYLKESSLCMDCVLFFQYVCENSDIFLDNYNIKICYSYFILMNSITRITQIFSDDPEYFDYVFILIDNYELFPNNQKNLIFVIITNILMYNEDIDFLNDLYNSSEHEMILNIALSPSDDAINQLNIGAQNVIKRLYIAYTKYCNDIHDAGEVLAKFFDTVSSQIGLGEYLYDMPNNIQFIIRTSSIIIDSFPYTYTVIYDDHKEYFHKLFEYMRIDFNGKNYSSIAFQLVTLIIRQLPQEDQPDLYNIIDWDSLMNFFNYMDYCHDYDFRNMLLFSEAYLRFGSAKFHQFYEKGFFHILIEKLTANDIKFNLSIVAVNCLVTAINFSGAPTQIYYLFQEGVLPILLSFLENDSDEKLTDAILDSIGLIWDSCNSVSSKIPANAADDFAICFRDECGYEILNNLNTCSDKAQHLNDILGDPPDDDDDSY